MLTGLTIQLRAERADNGTGRIYTIKGAHDASSHKSREVGPGLVQALPARSALMPSPEGNSFPADRKHRTGSLVAGNPSSAIRAGELCAIESHPAATFP